MGDNKLIRVLHVGMSSNPGGVENLILNYHRNVDCTKVQFDYLDIYGEGLAFSTEIMRLGGNIYSLPNYKKHPLGAVNKLKKILDENKFDIMHVHMQSAANLLPIIVGIEKKLPVICHSHSSSTPNGAIRKILNCFNIKRLRKYHVAKWACGMKAGKWMWGEDFQKENVIPNAIDTNLYRKDVSIRNKTRQELSINENDKVIGFVGRFGDEKNTFFLIEILKELLKIDEGYKLLTVGGNGLYDQFVEKIKAEKLEKYYYSAGIQNSALNWYQAMDAFLLPSFFEGFPMVGVEAQAVGLHCFMSNRISREIDITDSIEFLPIEPGSSTLWAKKISEALSTKSKKIEFPENYKIMNAAAFLTDRYMKLVGREKK